MIKSDVCSSTDLNGLCTVVLSNLMNSPGYDILYSFTDENNYLYTEEETGVLIDNVVYYVTIYSPSDVFSVNRGTFDSIIDNFVINLPYELSNTNSDILTEHPKAGVE
jgi:hypothetical protein